MTAQQQAILISGIVVVGERKDDLRALAKEYWAALEATGKAFELLFVVDGRQVDARSTLEAVRCDDRLPIKIIQLSRSFGDATALMCGVDRAVGETLVTLPAYYQVDALEIPGLIQQSGNSELVLAVRTPRRGGRFERIRRGTFHRILESITGSRFNDLGCQVRALNRKVLDELRLYGDQHRFLPVLARNAGFTITEVEIKQSEKDDFRSRYRLREYLHRLLDIFTIFFLVRFTKKPLRFFGMIGSIIGIIGGLILGSLVFERIFLGQALADRPAMLLSSLLVVLGLQLFSLGLLGELIIFTHARALKEYKVAELIGFEKTGDNAGGE